ncbi:thymidine kinase [Mycoplasma buteonis]|uniref:thymidine kinase n=1 Tax=Mycoplasma buteonis TaxID=171280 RepID=UPI00056C7282|nr:thymidine kinase [Mycoplasma buteonis]
MFYKSPTGFLEVITGPMFAGKSAELIKRITIWKIAKVNAVIFKPAFDNRFKDDEIVSRTGSHIQAYTINNSNEIWKYISKDTQAVAFDEVQFFDENVSREILKLVNLGIKVIVSGLDMDYEGKTFSVVTELLGLCDSALKLKAVCMQCHGQANMSFRKINSNNRHLLGDDTYEARCRECHQKGMIENQKTEK